MSAIPLRDSRAPVDKYRAKCAGQQSGIASEVPLEEVDPDEPPWAAYPATRFHIGQATPATGVFLWELREIVVGGQLPTTRNRTRLFRFCRSTVLAFRGDVGIRPPIRVPQFPSAPWVRD